MTTAIRPRPSAVLLALALALSSPASANVVPCGAAVPAGVVCLSANTSDTAGGGPLVAGVVYHVTGDVNVPAGETLTVETGAIVKFHPMAKLEVRGTLACGAATFTSVRDDTVGGDTNGDGPSTGAPGDWGGLWFFFAASAGSTVEGAEVRYGTSGITHFGTTVDSADVTHTQVAVRWCSYVGFSSGSFCRPTVTGCVFEGNRLAVQANVAALPGFLGNSASDNVQGDCIEIIEGTVRQGTVVVGPQNSLDGRPFAVCPSIVVEAGATLDLRPGVVLKFGNVLGAGFPFCDLGDVAVAGTLLADGVVITSLEDDTIGGDLDKNGPTFGSPGDRGFLSFQPTAGASVLRDTLVRFGGAFALAPFVAPAIDLVAADVVLENVDVAECSGAGLRLNAGMNGSFPTVNGCSFSDNLGPAVDRVPVGAVAGFSENTAARNAVDTMQVSGPTSFLDGFAAIEKASSLNQDGAFLMGGRLTVNPGAELALGAGTVLKWPVGTFGLTVNGTLTAVGTAAEPVVLTSAPDDSVVGDSNGDGAATQPARGDWIGVDLGVGAGASVLDGVVVRYAGRATQANASLELLGDATIRNALVELSQTGAIDLNGLAQPAVSGCTFRDNDGLAVANAIVRALQGFTDNVATGNGQGDHVEVVNGDVSAGDPADGGATPLTIGPANALAPARVFVVADDLDVPPGYLLSILGGTLVKWRGARELDVEGSLQVGSLGGGTAVFTSLEDDSVAGDTGKDGFTEGTPGDWRGVVLRAPGSVLQDALVRFAGGGAGGVSLVGADARLDGVRVEDCLGAGLHLNASSLPVVDGCAFDRNDLAVDGVPLRALPGFSNSTAQDNGGGDYQRITDGTLATGLLVQPSQAVNGGVFVLAADLRVLPGVVLTVDPGVTFKAQGNRLVDVQGTLLTPGPIVFTTLTDDLNGDTNEDGSTTVPVPGSWQGLDFGDGADDGVVVGLRVRYAGSGTVPGPALSLDRADVTILDSLVERSAGAGLRLLNDARPQVRRSSFVENQGIPVDGVTLGAVQGFLDNLASGNAPGDYLRITDDAIGGQATLARWNALNGNGVFVVSASLQVGAPDSLTLFPGTILKFQGIGQSLVNLSGVLDVAGTGHEPVVLTSIHDDAVGGDTRRDGATTVPAPGDWDRFEVGSGAAASRIEHLLARYGGSGSFAAIELESELATARSIRADHSAADGIRGHRHAGDAANWVAFGCLGDGIELAGGAYDLVHATAGGNGGIGIRRIAGHAGRLWSSISHANGGAPVVGFVPGEVFSSNVGPGFAGFDGNVDADPLFADPTAGDLTLGAGSPCVDAADPAVALGVAEDHVEASRILDDGLDGSALPDMGAFERATYSLCAAGELRPGRTIVLTAQGSPPGLALFTLGFLDGTTFQDPLGFTLYGTAGSGTVIGFAPTEVPVAFPVPSFGPTPGLELGVQALVRAFGGPLVAAPGATPRTLPAPAPASPAQGPGRLSAPGPGRVGQHTNLFRGFVGPP